MKAQAQDIQPSTLYPQAHVQWILYFLEGMENLYEAFGVLCTT